MVVRELVALMGIKTDKKGFQDAEKGMGKMVKLAKVAAAAFASLQVVKWVKSAIVDVAELGDRFDKLSKRTGIATTTLQQFEHAAELSGASLGDVESSLRRLQASQVDAAAGLKTYTREWDRLGIEIQDSEGNFKDTTELLIEMADGMQNLESDAERTAVATKLLGRGGTALIPMFKEGSAALREMMGELVDYGGIIEEDLIKQSADFIDNQRRVDMSILSIKNTIAKEALPWINRATSSMLEWWKQNGRWIRQGISRVFKALSPIVARLAETIGKVLRVGVKIIAWTSKFIKNMDPFKKKILGVATALGVIIKLFRAGAFGKFLLVVGLIFLALDDLFAFLKGKPSLLGRLNDKLIELFDLDLYDAIEGVKLFFDTLAAEGQDWEVVWGGLWNEILLVLKDYLALAGQWWSDFWAWFVSPVEEFVVILQNIFEGLLTIILFPFAEGLKFITDVFEVGIIGALDRLRIKVIDWANAILDTISAPFKAIGKWIAGKAGAPFMQGAANVQAGGAGMVAGPVKAGAAGGAPIVNNQSNNIKIDVAATPGMDEGRLSKAVGKEVQAIMDRSNRKTIQALTPVVPAIPGT